MLSMKVASLPGIGLLLLSSVTNAYKTIPNALQLERIYRPKHHYSSRSPVVLGYALNGTNHYTTNVTIGGQQIPILVDTGSSDTWVLGSHFNYPGAHIFNENSRNFRKIDGATFEVVYGGTGHDSATGPMGSVRMILGGIEIPRQVIGLATSGTFDETSFGGILGLGLSELQNSKLNGEKYQPDMVTASMRKNGLEASIFSVALTDEGGQLAFGGLPAKVAFIDRWVTTPATSGLFGITFLGAKYYYWSTTVEIIANNYTSSFFSAVVDTGTPIDLVSATTAAKVASMYIPPARRRADGHYYVPCAATPPKYGVKFGEETIWYKSESMLIPANFPNDPIGYWCISPLADDPFAISELSSTVNILGAPFMRNVLAVFDFERKEMAFAPTF